MGLHITFLIFLYSWRFERDSNAGKCWAYARCFDFYCKYCHFIFSPTKARFAPVLGLYFMQKIKIKTRCFHNEYLIKILSNFNKILVADGEGFEPPVELPPQRFSRPSQSTALPPILNFLYRRSFKPTVLFAARTWRCCSPLVRTRLR